MTSSPSVSVLVPAWNDGTYLDTALRSLAEQTWRDFEAVVSDDGSTDDTPAIAATWAARDSRFRLLRNDQNRGMAANWNAALRAARGELVTKLDADDAATPDFLAAMVPELADPAHAAAFCRTTECDAELRPVAPWSGERAFADYGLDPATRLVRRGDEWLAMSFDDQQLWHSDAFLVRREEMLAMGGWDERFRCAADTDLILRLLETNRPVVHVPAVGVLYRRRPQSVSARAAADGWKRLEGIAVSLASLARAGGPLAKRRRALRQNWWRLWRAGREARRDSRLATSLSAAHAEQLLPLLDEPPPLWIRAEGELRVLGWRAKQALRRPRAERAAS